MIYIYNLLCYVFRIFLIDKLNVTLNKDNIEQYFLSIYDWKYTNDCNDNKIKVDKNRLKSIAYKMSYFFVKKSSGD